MEDKLKYHLRFWDGVNWNYYYVDGNGDVDTTTTQTAINYTPAGWSESVINWERGFEYFGVVRSYSTPLRFVKDAAKILKHLFITYGVNAKCELYIELLDRTIATYGYAEIYRGDFNFRSFQTDDRYVSIEIMEGGFYAKRQARDNTVHEVPVDNNVDKIWVKLHPCKLQFRQTWITPENEDLNLTNTYLPTHIMSSIYEGTNLYMGVYDEINIGSSAQLISNLSSSSQDVLLNYHFDINVFVPGGTTVGAPYKFRLYYEMVEISNPSVVVSEHNIQYGTPLINSGASQTFTGDNSQVITIPAGHQIIVVKQLETTTGSPGNVSPASYDCTQLGSTLEMIVDQMTDTKYFPALKPKKVFETIVDEMTDGETTAASSYLDTHEDKVLTCGDAICNLENSVIKIDFNTLFKAFMTRLSTSLIYDRDTDTCTLARFLTAFDDTDGINLGEFASLEIEPMTDLIFTNLNIGYRENVYDKVNGKDEFNTLSKYRSPIIGQTEDYSLVSDVRTDMYGILSTALNLNGKKSTDASTDNDVFWVHADISAVAGQIPYGLIGAGEDYYDLYRDNTLTISNIYDTENAFNIFFTPRRCMIENEPLIHSLLYGNDAESLKFQTSTKTNNDNTKMVTDDGVTIIDEGADIVIGDMEDPAFVPIYAQIEVMSDINLNEEMKTKSYKRAYGTYKGITYKGFIIKASMELDFPTKQKYRLLFTTGTDLTNLIT